MLLGLGVLVIARESVQAGMVPVTGRKRGVLPLLVLLEPRQNGKTTLARKIAAKTPDSVYLDLDKPRDAARLADPGGILIGTPGGW